MPIGLLLCETFEKTPRIEAIEASRIIRFVQEGKLTQIDYDGGKVLSCTPYQKLIDDYADLVKAAREKA